MKVLWLSHLVPYPPAGGALQRAYNLLRHACRTHEVHLVALNQPRLLAKEGIVEAADALSTMCASVHVFPLPAERSHGHRLLCAARSVASGAPFDAVWLRSARLERHLSELRNGRRFDLVHVDTVGLWPFVESWRRQPIILGHHNVESDLAARRAFGERRRWRAGLLRRDAIKLRTLEHSAARAATVNIVVSDLDARRLSGIAPNAAIEVISNGVDAAYWRPRPDAAIEGRIVFAGTLSWFPNRDAISFLLDEIWPALRSTDRHRSLLLVGRNPPAMAVAAARDPCVQVTGFVSDARPYIASASICVSPVRVGGGTRLKILDALAMAKPVVATQLAVEGLDLVEGVHYLRADSAPEFVAQVRRLEDDPVLRTALGDAGRELVAGRFDWRVIGSRLDAAFEHAVSSHRTAQWKPA